MLTIRILLGTLSAIVFIQFALIYGANLWRFSTPRNIGAFGVGGLLLGGAAEQYKAWRYDFPVDWVTWLLAVSVVVAFIGQSITIRSIFKKEREISDE